MATEYVTGGPPRFQHQRRGLNKMIQTGGVCALLFDPGLGKTATVLDYAGLLALKAGPGGEARVLVICPLAAVDTWVLQAEKFVSPMVNYWAEALGGSILEKGEALANRGGNSWRNVDKTTLRTRHIRKSLAVAMSGGLNPAGGIDALGSEKPRLVIEVVNIDAFASRAHWQGKGSAADYMLESVRRFAPDLVVVDESHKIKSPTGNASRLLGRISRVVKRRVILTGTVMPHSPMDVFGQWRFLDPYAFGVKNNSTGVTSQATFGGFRGRFAIMGGYLGREYKGFVNLDDMQEIMSRNAVVARKADALDLPPTLDVVIPVHLSADEKKAYEELRTSLATTLLGGATSTVPNMLTQMMRLRQITSGCLPDDNGVMHVLGDSKVQVIRSLVQDTLVGETRIVVFCMFTHEIQELRRVLSEAGTEVMTITGMTPVEDRALFRKRFGSDDPSRMVMVAQIQTMNLAVNELVTASHAIFGSLSQQRDDMIQAKARLDRQGQTKPVTFWLAVAPGTVDEVILKAHQDRTDLETAMLRHIAGTE